MRNNFKSNHLVVVNDLDVGRWVERQLLFVHHWRRRRGSVIRAEAVRSSGHRDPVSSSSSKRSKGYVERRKAEGPVSAHPLNMITICPTSYCFLPVFKHGAKLFCYLLNCDDLHVWLEGGGETSMLKIPGASRSLLEWKTKQKKLAVGSLRLADLVDDGGPQLAPKNNELEETGYLKFFGVMASQCLAKSLKALISRM